MSSRDNRRIGGNSNAVNDSQGQAYGSARIYTNVWLNGRAAGKMVIDSGADITVISTTTARACGINTAAATGSINIQGVASNSKAPLVPVSMKIEAQPAFNTTIAVSSMSLPFNLLAVKDATRVYNVNITASGTKLVPRAQVGAAGESVLPAIDITHGTPLTDLPITPAQVKLVIAVFIVLLAVSAAT